MPYKKPGAYARFVQTAGAVNNPGSSRVMAIIGTGKMFFDQLSEPVLRQSDTASDLLSKENVYEIYHVTSKPLKNGSVDLTGGGKEYVEGTDFDLKDGKYIAWKIDSTKAANASLPLSSGTAGGDAFVSVVSASVTSDYLVTNGDYKIEITYIDTDTPSNGTYAIIDAATNQVLGEYQVGTTAISVIPGISLFVTDTFIAKTDSGGNPIAGQSVTTTGDYVTISTFAGGTVNSAASNGSAYYVSYAYKKADTDFVPKVFTDYQDLVAEYGDYDITASGKVINSLALGAEIAFLNGVNPIVCVQANSDSDFAIQKAIDLLERDIAGINNINTIVPLTTSTTVAAAAKVHVDKMSDSSIGKERMLYVGAPDGESYTASATSAAGFNDERVVYVVPTAATKQIRSVVTGKTAIRRIPACYLAVAVAAIGLKNDPAEPLTNKYIGGVDSLGTLYTESEKNTMAEQGCLILEQYGSNIRIRHGQTTSVAEVNSNEITLVQIKDYVIDATRKTLGDLYIGRKLMPSVVSDVQLTLVNILNQFVGQSVILGYSSVTAKRSKDDPRAIDVSFEIEAVYPLNYINIQFSFSGIS